MLKRHENEDMIKTEARLTSSDRVNHFYPLKPAFLDFKSAGAKTHELLGAAPALTPTFLKLPPPPKKKISCSPPKKNDAGVVSEALIWAYLSTYTFLCVCTTSLTVALSRMKSYWQINQLTKRLVISLSINWGRGPCWVHLAVIHNKQNVLSKL